jgi:hypothetical protein
MLRTKHTLFDGERTHVEPLCFLEVLADGQQRRRHVVQAGAALRVSTAQRLLAYAQAGAEVLQCLSVLVLRAHCQPQRIETGRHVWMLRPQQPLSPRQRRAKQLFRRSELPLEETNVDQDSKRGTG